MAGAGDQVDVAGPQASQHLGQDGFVVLHVAVHRRQVGRVAGHHALDDGRREAAAIDAVHQAHAGVGAR